MRKSSPLPPEPLLVCAALIEKSGLFLLAKRPSGKYLAGHWEFPGGKVLPNESPQVALAREIQEELGVAVAVGELFLDHQHTYPERTIRLLTFRCTIHEPPQALEHEVLAWVAPQAMSDLLLSPADVQVVGKLMQNL